MGKPAAHNRSPQLEQNLKNNKPINIVLCSRSGKLSGRGYTYLHRNRTSLRGDHRREFLHFSEGGDLVIDS